MSSTRREIPVRNPLTGAVDYIITPPTLDELDTIASQLRHAQVSWAARPMNERIEVMLRWADALETSASSLIEADSTDTGWASISRASPFLVLGMIRDWCRIAEETLDSVQLSGSSSLHPSMEFQTQLVPYELVGVISPWNAPLMQSMMDAIPALLAGCAVLVKPSEVAPRFVDPLLQTIAEVPSLRSVFHVVTGDREVGEAIVNRADVICFTGSVATGRSIAEAAARRLIPVYLELGGNDPVIVTETADLSRAAEAIVAGAVSGTGQVCFAVERVYVHTSVADSLTALICEQAAAITLNSAAKPTDGQIGPFGFAPQASIVAAQLQDALDKGAQLVEGGFPFVKDGADYMRPTVLTGVDHSMRVMQEETFGPVIPIATYSTLEEAINLANSTEYGLSASVFSGDIAEAQEIARHLRAGTVSVQDTCLTTYKGRDIGNDAFGSSGLGGDRTGPRTILRYVRKKSILTNPGPRLRLGSQPVKG